MVFERENNVSYMVLECLHTRDVTYDVNIIEKNIMSGLLPMHMRKVNNNSLYYYDVTSKQQLTKLFTYTQLRWDDVVMICNSISAMVKEINAYMLDLNCVYLMPEYLYVDLSERKVCFVYYPECGEGVGETLEECSEQFSDRIRNLFDYILEHYDHSSDKEELMNVYAIYQRIMQNNYNAEKLGELVVQEAGTKIEQFAEEKIGQRDAENLREARVKEEVEQKIRIEAVPDEVLEDEVEEKNVILVNIVLGAKVVAALLVGIGLIKILLPTILPVAINSKAALIMIVLGVVAFLLMNKIPKHMLISIKDKKYTQPYEVEWDNSTVEKVDGKESFMTEAVISQQSSEPHTMLMSDYIHKRNRKDDVKLRLFRKEDNELLDIEKFPAIIGSMKEKCSVYIDNALVSRIHCCIVSEGGEYYIEDLNSTNGTSVNGESLLPDVKRLLKNGDEILLATQSYKVEMG